MQQRLQCACHNTLDGKRICRCLLASTQPAYVRRQRRTCLRLVGYARAGASVGTLQFGAEMAPLRSRVGHASPPRTFFMRTSTCTTSQQRDLSRDDNPDVLATTSKRSHELHIRSEEADHQVNACQGHCRMGCRRL